MSDPSHGVAFGEEMTGDPLHESTAELNLDFEVPADRWQPLAADDSEPVPSTILFLDGVRRIVARVWLHAGDAQPAPGIAASYAAGLVCLNGTARISDVTVERGPGAGRGRCSSASDCGKPEHRSHQHV